MTISSHKEKIWLSPPHMSGAEMKYIQQAFDSNWIAPMGPNVKAFEEELCAYTGMDYAVALNSGTAAIHLALIALGVQQGDEVICSSFTFSATANPIAYLGATPVFVESEASTWNISPDFLEAAIKDRLQKGRKVKAIIAVHLYGNTARLHEIISIAERYSIPLIEDAAESLGSRYKGKMTGTFGRIGIYSFNGNKIITTSGGGALVTADKNIADQVLFLAMQARDKAPHYQHSQIGYNYRMSNVLSGIGQGQLKVIEERIEARRNVFVRYRKALSDISSISFAPEEIAEGSYNRWLTCILIKDKNNNVSPDDLRKALEEENIESRPLWKPMHTQPVFKDAPYYGDHLSEKLFASGLCLPSGSAMTEEQLERVVDVIRKEFRD
ncbi:MAG TPA: aminotransferase class I/II-fold pyridoxal phosphate-dependent enzyme [Cytophagaceae bacterium]|nr:aminotransferase class I/II-fold pyridoxal phosphate-dependent enzyme [Cytophagaceae bacterium]